jgi:hypothetical protein
MPTFIERLEAYLLTCSDLTHAGGNEYMPGIQLNGDISEFLAEFSEKKKDATPDDIRDMVIARFDKLRPTRDQIYPGLMYVLQIRDLHHATQTPDPDFPFLGFYAKTDLGSLHLLSDVPPAKDLLGRLHPDERET